MVDTFGAGGEGNLHFHRLLDCGGIGGDRIRLVLLDVAAVMLDGEEEEAEVGIEVLLLLLLLRTSTTSEERRAGTSTRAEKAGMGGGGHRDARPPAVSEVKDRPG